MAQYNTTLPAKLKENVGIQSYFVDAWYHQKWNVEGNAETLDIPASPSPPPPSWSLHRFLTVPDSRALKRWWETKEWIRLPSACTARSIHGFHPWPHFNQHKLWTFQASLCFCLVSCRLPPNQASTCFSVCSQLSSYIRHQAHLHLCFTSPALCGSAVFEEFPLIFQFCASCIITSAHHVNQVSKRDTTSSLDL